MFPNSSVVIEMCSVMLCMIAELKKTSTYFILNKINTFKDCLFTLTWQPSFETIASKCGSLTQTHYLQNYYVCPTLNVFGSSP